uniref:Secreted protein n=1 Tax=Panstrongylus lignarius TaxID=156445 RepID=A0A224Y663_9HEMI
MFPVWPTILAIFTILPLCSYSLRATQADFTTLYVPVKLTSITFLNISCVIFSRKLSRVIPAEFITIFGGVS